MRASNGHIPDTMLISDDIDTLGNWFNFITVLIRIVV
jgi:hypothetical protein